ncbi:choline transport protein, partial [Tremellales sp. Uapishka_1]
MELSPHSSDGKDKVPIGIASNEVVPVGGEVSLKRNLTALNIIGLSLSICNGWAAMSSTIVISSFAPPFMCLTSQQVIGLSQGGTPVVLYGLIFTSLINFFLALTLGEMAAAYPSAGGQYVWSSILAGPRTRRGLSFIVGWVTIFEWITTVASVVIISAEVVLAIAQLFNEDFVIQRWMVFVVFMAFNSISFVFNLLAAIRTPWIGKVFLFFSSTVFLVILITCVAKTPSYQSNHFVWGTYTNGIGWNNGFVVVATGLVNPAYVFAGLDGAIHIAEDCLAPARAVPYALFSTVGMGLFTGFAMSVGLLYCIQDLDAALASELPFLAIVQQSISNRAGTTILMVSFLLCLMVSSNSVHQATSRLIWSFARDQGMPWAKQLGTIHPTLRVPVIPLTISFAGVTILGALYVGSTTVYGSIIACCIILGNISYAIPATVLMLRGRKMNPARWLKLGGLGWVANIITVVWCLFTTVMWLFPLEPKPTSSEMNYSVAVLGGMALIMLADWVFWGRKHFIGPDVSTLRIVIDGVRDTSVIGSYEASPYAHKVQDE